MIWLSYLDLYMNRSPLIEGPRDPQDPDATVLGVPFDATHSYRPGCRFGPGAIREAFNNTEIFHPGLGVDLEGAAIEDLGNARHTVDPQEMVRMVGRLVSEIAPSRRQLVLLGGEHSITYPAYTAFPRGTGYVVFDAHYDLRDGFADSRLSHASYLRRIVEERGADGVLHVGARAFAAEELAFLKEHRIMTVSDAQVRAGEGPGLVSGFASSFDSVYVSLDLDVLDPAFAPGVGNPEAAGITSRELLGMVGALGGTRVPGADIVELNPYHDNGATAALAARVLSTLVAQNMRAGS